ncbi:hypothetical protein QWY28_16245 [Nocardioides sp. SOB77]|uniref:O-antigen ligase family protein n=1 Tax=Nocardioides oceani TaxID=3058369 RepID=A0ABT8FJE5_9ACTN|nr:hypothetical protein [Nocardioides oceani]MDN4174512.1 hypothetical protein [Nocardioides oceani]
MTMNLATLVVLGFGGAVLIGIVAGYRDVRQNWDASSIFVCLGAWLLIGPSTFVQFTSGTQVLETDLSVTVIVRDPRFAQVTQVATFGLAFLSLAVLAVGVMNSRKLWPPLLGIVLIIGLQHATSWYLGVSSVLDVRLLALSAFALAAATLPRGKGARAGIAVVGISIVLVSSVVTLVNPDAALKSCRDDKCGPLGYLFFGAATGENPLGLLLASTLPAIYLATRSRARWLCLGGVLATVWITGSRTALFASAIVVSVAVLSSWRRTGDGNLWRPVIGIATAGALAGALLPTIGLEPGAFTGRAYLWDLAIERMHGFWLFGHGGLEWGRLVDTGVLQRAQAYAVHNQWLDLLYTGGLVGVSILMAVLAFAWRDSEASPSVKAFLFLPVIYTGFLERLWSFGVLDVWGWLSIATLLALGGTSEKAETSDGGYVRRPTRSKA